MAFSYRVRRFVLIAGILAALAVSIDRFPAQPVSGANAGTPLASGPASAPGDLAAPAQSALDRILGPDHSLVTAYASYTQPAHKSSVTYGSKAVAVSQARASGPGYQSTVVNNGVNVTLTDSSPAGPQISRMTVAVVVDSALRPAPNLAVVRKTVSAALGLQLTRGDRISVTATPIAGPAPVVGAGTSSRPRWAGHLSSLLAVALAAALALALLVDSLLNRRRRSSHALG